MSEDSRIRSPRESLARNFERHLSIYSTSAAIAGVGLLALAKPAEGEIVVTKVNIPICGSTIDLNKDGVPDFSFPCSPEGKPSEVHAALLGPMPRLSALERRSARRHISPVQWESNSS